MRILPASREALLCFLVSLLFTASFCHGSDESTSLFQVVGTGECADCSETNFKTSQAVSGLRVTIDCKPKNGEFKKRGSGELGEDGRFTVSLPEEIVEDGKLKEECYAQLHSASAAPCPAHDGLESSKIVLKTKTNGEHTFGLAGKLKFSSVTCASAFLWPHYKYKPLPKFNLPPLTSLGHHSFPFPPKVFPPKPPLPSLPPKPPLFKKPFPPKPLPPPVPVKPLPPPPVPVKKPPPPPVPVKKPPPPPVPVKKPPPPPVPVKPLPPPVPKFPPKPKVLPPKPPVFKKPFPPKPPLFKPPPIPKVLPPPVPIYKPKPKPPIFVKPLPPPIPKVLPPPVPIYKPKPKPPIFVKPLPPLPKTPPFYKKPCPPLPKLPPVPKIPPKSFHHPKFGKWPPVPPFSPHSN